MIGDADQHQHALYFDLEFTCWDAAVPVGRKPEIIEIGAVEADLNSLAIVREAAYLIRPRHLDISNRCTSITGLTRDDLREAPSFEEVFERFVREFDPQRKLCGTWGRDANIFSEACRAHGLRTPLRHIVDVGELFWRAFLLRELPGLRAAVEMLGLEFDGAPHMALADARNTAHVHAAIIRRMRRMPDPAPARGAPPAPPEQPTLLGQKLAQLLDSAGK